MNFIPYGIYTGKGMPPEFNPSNYSDKFYDGVRGGYDRKNNPVVIMHCKRDDPYRWKVVYGFSTVFFENFKEAMDFCNSHEMRMFKENEDSHHE